MTSPTGTILIVDDEFSIVETLEDILTWEGYTVITAADGKRALEVIDKQTPSVVLLDYMMPVMDGLELLKVLRRDSVRAKLPVILMTAATVNFPPEKRLWDALLRKPFDVSTLLRTLATVSSARHFTQ